MKIHVGCGSVFLRNWLNVDMPLPTVFLASERPDLSELFAATEENYYGKHRQKGITVWREGASMQETVCDAYGSFASLPARPGSAEEILARQVFEHVPMNEAAHALRECHRVLRLGGTLRLDVPDPDETLRLYRETGDNFYIRHLFGPRLNEFGLHTLYTRKILRDLAVQAGFHFLEEEENIHPYPAFCLRFKSK